jgi:phosphoribosyl 1,2-cyclic phosphodiesterase
MPEAGLLIDAGLSGRETERRLAQIDVSPDCLLGICLSHEHGDHTAGIGVLHRRYGIALYANKGTIEGVSRNRKLRDLPWNIFHTGSAFQVGPLVVDPFSVSHDAMEPVGFVIRGGDATIGIVTDMGIATSLVRERLKACDAVVIESNHDETMLGDAERPWYLKQRILGRQGHLSNKGAAETVAEIAGPRLSHVFLAHISDDCNRRELALEVITTKLRDGGHDHVGVSCSFPDRISDLWTLPPRSG